MNTFEITLQRRAGDSWPVVVEENRPGVGLPLRGEGFLRLDTVELTSPVTPRDYGMVLGRALFHDIIRDAFAAVRRASADCLRVLLFVEVDDLKTLRWERLCAPLDGGWRFLALDQRLPFSLYLPTSTDRRFPPIGRRDLRALVLVASPDGLEQYRLDPFDAFTAVASARTSLGEIPVEVLATAPSAVGRPTLDMLCEQITAQQYTLLHLVCHGRLTNGTANREPILYLADASNRVDPVTATRLLERLGGLRGARGLPHFAFLAACHSGSSQAGAFGGLAQRLVRELGMPAVLAMTDAVSVETAQALAASFYRRLREHGEVDRGLVEACAGLAERHDVTGPALYSRLGGRPLFSATLDRPLSDAEITAGLARLESLLGERAPVLRPAFDQSAAALRSSQGTDAAALSAAARQERKQALAEINTLSEEAVDLSFNALALGQDPPAHDARCPFRGLYPFRAEDREFFFGREALVARLQARLAEHHFLAVLGPSGSGKSSLVLAGLLPALQDRETDLHVAVVRLSSEPLVQLEAGLSKLLHPPAVLVVDQFEELFTLCPDEEQRRTFVDRLLALSQHLRVVLTMRADFWGECAPYRILKERMQAHQELIAPMDAAELRRAMELQAAKVGLRFEADLANTLLDDVQGEPGAMPLLQHALQELWKRRHGRWLRAEEYRAIGGVQQSVAGTADGVYDTLSVDERERMRDIVVRLTRLDVEPVQGEQRQDTRRRVAAAELVPVNSDPAATKRLVTRLANARLVVTGVNEATGREEMEVAHEALIRYWPRLRDWLEEDRASLRLREGIREAAWEWETGGKNDSLLVHRGSRLEEAEALAKHPRFTLNAREQEYVDACVALRERERAKEDEWRRREVEAARKLAAAAEAREREQAKAAARLRQRAILLAGAGIAAGVLALTALVLLGIAEQERDRAEQQSRLALTRQLAAQALVSLEAGPQRSLLLALEAVRIAPQIAGIPLTEPEESLRQTLAATGGIPLRGHQSGVTTVAFSPDGGWLATASSDKTVRLWEAGNPTAPPVVLGEHERFVSAAAFSPDGRWLATGSGDRTVRLWDLLDRTAAPLVLRGHPREVRALAFSPDGRWLATGSEDGAVRLWQVADSMAPPAIVARHESSIWALAFSPDGRTLAAGGWAKTVWLHEVANPMAPPVVLPGHDERVLAVTFSPDGRTLASGSDDRTVRLWDAVDPGASSSILWGHESTVTSLAFSPDGRTLASGSDDRTVRLWNAVDPGATPSVLPGHENGVTSLTFSPDGRWLATGSSDWTVHLRDAASPTASSVVLLGHESTVTGLAFSPDGRTLASGSDDRTVRLWQMADSTAPPVVLRGHESTVTSLDFSLDGRTLASGSRDETVRLWLPNMDELIQLACRVAGRNLSEQEWQQFLGERPYHKTCPDLAGPGDCDM